MLELILSIAAGIFFVLLINGVFAAISRSVVQDVRNANKFANTADTGGFVMQGMKKNLKTGKSTPQQRPVSS